MSVWLALTPFSVERIVVTGVVDVTGHRPLSCVSFYSLVVYLAAVFPREAAPVKAVSLPSSVVSTPLLSIALTRTGEPTHRWCQ